MKNPYKTIFELTNNGDWHRKQNATKKEITDAFKIAFSANNKLKKYTQQELMTAQKQLLEPSKRLAADFMFPSKYKTKRAPVLVKNTSPSYTDIDAIDENAFDNLEI